MLRAGWLLVALMAAGIAGAKPQASEAPSASLAAPTAEDFAAKPFMLRPKLAPDGRRYAARTYDHGKTKITVVTPHADAAPEIELYGLPAGRDLRFFRWAGPDRILVGLGYGSRFEGEDVYLSRLIVIDLASGKSTALMLPEMGFVGDELVYVDPKGDYALVAMQASPYEYPGVHRFDLATGKHKEVVPERKFVWDWYADDNGVVRAAYASESGQGWWLYRASERDPFKRLTRPSVAGKVDDNINDLQPVQGGDLGYATATTPQGRMALFRYNFATGTPGELIWEHPKVDIDNVRYDRAGQPYAIDYTDDRPRVEWLDPELKKVQRGIDKAVPDATNQIISISADAQRMLVSSSAADRPPVYYLFDRTTHRLDPTAIPYERMQGKRLSPMRTVSYRARDGLEIPAFLTLPAGRGEKGLPLIVMPHGGPFVRDSWGYDVWVQFLASRGYAVLQPNYRGSTGYGRTFVEAGYGEWGRKMQDDIDDGAKWLIAQGVADPKRVCIMGASFGGYAALWASVRNPDIYRCAISFAGISDVGAMLRYDRKSFSATRYFRNWRDKVQGNQAFDLRTVSPLFVPEKMSMPLMIAHGSADTNVPMSQSASFHEALQKLGKPHDYLIYKDEGHGLDDEKNHADFLLRVGAFLNQHNPA